MPAETQEALTINQAAEVTGWSPRMLRYIDRVGLVRPPRSNAGYRLFRAQELQRIRTLRLLLDEFDLGLSEVAFSERMRSEPRLGEALESWFAAEAVRPLEVAADEWLDWEQRKHERLLAA